MCGQGQMDPFWTKVPCCHAHAHAHAACTTTEQGLLVLRLAAGADIAPRYDVVVGVERQHPVWAVHALSQRYMPRTLGADGRR